MKKYIVMAFMALMAGFAFTFQSCKGDPDPCEELTCQNGGNCTEGTCECPEYFFGEVCEDRCVSGAYENGACNCSNGYEGETCETQMRQKFIGSWSTYEKCANLPNEYNYTMVGDISSEGILVFTIDNFRDDTGNPLVLCTVDKDNTQAFVIEDQPFGSNGQRVEGTGGFNATSDTITIDYKLSFGNGAEFCTMKLY